MRGEKPRNTLAERFAIELAKAEGAERPTKPGTTIPEIVEQGPQTPAITAADFLKAREAGIPIDAIVPRGKGL